MHPIVSLVAGALALMGSIAMAAAPAASSVAASADAVYQKERAACLDPDSKKDRTACLKEADAALADTRRSKLGNNEDAKTLAANAIERCKAKPEKERPACERLARNEAAGSGSVEGGGVLKERVTISVVPAASAASAASASASEAAR